MMCLCTVTSGNKGTTLLRMLIVGEAVRGGVGMDKLCTFL